MTGWKFEVRDTFKAFLVQLVADSNKAEHFVQCHFGDKGHCQVPNCDNFGEKRLSEISDIP